ncbi:MAG: hypothetical protein QG644_24 [Patescibacteria group bacterium]|nr:hypothetical protein [Patescibacteria group bacterium]
MKMEGPNFNKIKRIGLGVVATVASLSMSNKAGGTETSKISPSTSNESSVGGSKIKDNSNTANFSGEKLENKDYKIDTMQVVEKGGEQYIVIKLTKHKGEYSSYQEVIEAIKKINPDITFLTPGETENFLSENRNNLSKRTYYVALGADVTGSPVDTKASGASGAQFNTYKFDGNGTVLIAGSASPSDNDYLFPAKMKVEKKEDSKETK